MIPAEIVVTVLFGWLVFHVARWAHRAFKMQDERDRLIGENAALQATVELLRLQLENAVRPAQSPRP